MKKKILSGGLMAILYAVYIMGGYLLGYWSTTKFLSWFNEE